MPDSSPQVGSNDVSINVQAKLYSLKNKNSCNDYDHHQNGTCSYFLLAFLIVQPIPEDFVSISCFWNCGEVPESDGSMR